MIGTKADLKNECDKYGRQIYNPITKENGDRLAREINAVGYMETSAYTGEGVQEAVLMGLQAFFEDFGNQLEYNDKLLLNLAISGGQHDVVFELLEKMPGLDKKGR